MISNSLKNLKSLDLFTSAQTLNIYYNNSRFADFLVINNYLTEIT